MIAGIDLSTKAVHICVREDGATGCTIKRVDLEIEKGLVHRDAMAARELAEQWPRGDFWEGCWLAGVEYPFTRGYIATSLKTICGAIMALLPKTTHPIPLQASWWQPRFCGQPMPRKSADRKPLIRARVVELTGLPDLPSLDQDAYDAFGISWIVEQVNDGTLK